MDFHAYLASDDEDSEGSEGQDRDTTEKAQRYKVSFGLDLAGMKKKVTDENFPGAPARGGGVWRIGR